MTESRLIAPPAPFGALALARLSPASMTLVLIAAFVVLRLAAACFIGLGTDESYSIAVARDVNLAYFDHPPMHYWLAHLAEPLAGVGRGGRVPFIALFAGSSWLMFGLTRRLFGEAAGFWAALALNLSGFFTVAAASWVLPDGPLDFALLAAASVLAMIWFGDAASNEAQTARPLLTWLAAGLCIGLAGLSKYQAALFCVGLGVFMISTARGRRQLLSPGPYLAAIVALAVLSPVLIWNATHGWASFAFQAGRSASRQFHPFGPLAALGGQLAILLPWISLPLAAAAISALRAGPGGDAKAERRWFCLTLALPPIVVFSLTPLIGPHSLPHWSMSGWLFLFPLLGERLAVAVQSRTWPRTWALASLAFVLLVGTLASYEAATGWLGQQFPKTFRRGDPTAESIEWTQLRPVIGQSGLMHEPGAFVVGLKWNEAGKLDQAVGDLAPVTALTDDPRQFAYRHPLSTYLGHDALIIGRAETVADRMKQLAPYFRSLHPLAPVHLGRDGHGEITIAIVEARDLLQPYQALHASHSQ